MKKIIMFVICLAGNGNDLYGQSTTILPSGSTQSVLQIGTQSFALGRYSSSFGLDISARSYASSAFGRF